jgi:hypothetical protein
MNDREGRTKRLAGKRLIDTEETRPVMSRQAVPGGGAI